MEFNLADRFEAVPQTVPDRSAVVTGVRGFSHRELKARTDRRSTTEADGTAGEAPEATP